MNENQSIAVPSGAQSITITVGGSQSGESPKTEPAQEQKSSPDTQEVEKSIEGDVAASEAEQKGDVELLIPKGDYRNDPLFFEVAEYFGLKEEDYNGYKNHMAHIVDYVIRDIESNDPTKVIPRIRQIEDSLQSPGWDEKRIANVHKYIRLAAKQQVFTKMMKAYQK